MLSSDRTKDAQTEAGAVMEWGLINDCHGLVSSDQEKPDAVVGSISKNGTYGVYIHDGGVCQGQLPWTVHAGDKTSLSCRLEKNSKGDVKILK